MEALKRLFLAGEALDAARAEFDAAGLAAAAAPGVTWEEIADAAGAPRRSVVRWWSSARRGVSASARPRGYRRRLVAA